MTKTAKSSPRESSTTVAGQFVAKKAAPAVLSAQNPPNRRLSPKPNAPRVSPRLSANHNLPTVPSSRQAIAPRVSPKVVCNHNLPMRDARD